MTLDFFTLKQLYSTGIAEAIMDQHGGEEPLKVCETECLVLYRWSDGCEVIETNGDPVFEPDNGFDELRADLVARGTLNTEHFKRC